MEGKRRLILLWFRQELRLHDNELFAELRRLYVSGEHEVACLFCFEPRIFTALSPYGNRRCGVHRANYYIKAVEAL